MFIKHFRLESKLQLLENQNKDLKKELLQHKAFFAAISDIDPDINIKTVESATKWPNQQPFSSQNKRL